MQIFEEFPIHQQVAQSASPDSKQKVEFTGRLRGNTVTNSADSGGKLWIGVNTEELIEAIEPGQSLPLQASENAYLRGFIVLAWDVSITDPNEKIGTIIQMKIGEQINDC